MISDVDRRKRSGRIAAIIGQDKARLESIEEAIRAVHDEIIWEPFNGKDKDVSA